MTVALYITVNETYRSYTTQSISGGFLENTRVLTSIGLTSITSSKKGERILTQSSARNLPPVRESTVLDAKWVEALDSRRGSPLSDDPESQDFIGEVADSMANIMFQLNFGPGVVFTILPFQPLYVEGRGWVEAHEVHVGDRLRGKDGPTPVITAIERVPPEPTYVIRTEGNLPYFVSPPGADFTIWVP